MEDIEGIHYRKVQTKAHIKALPNRRSSKLKDDDAILIKIAQVSTTLIAFETLLLLELNNKDTNLEELVSIMKVLTPIIDSQLIELGELTLHREDMTDYFIRELKRNIIHQPQIWEKYHADMFFSLQVEKYYEQLNYLINAEIKNRKMRHVNINDDI